MAALTKSALHDRWRDRWAEFLERVSETDNPAETENVLRDKVTIGNAERKIAGGHEGREILELLQNARDAIWKGDEEEGRVHVGVYDEGVLVANTGSRFDLFDTEVEDAVTMIGETGKGDDDDQSIGHKGVGLKSILATGDAFEIYTRPDPESDDIFGLRLSRVFLVASLLSRMGHPQDISQLLEDIDDGELTALITDDGRDGAIDLSHDLLEDISKLPLFNFPVPLKTRTDSSNGIQRRVRELLSETDDHQFRTAVFIRYEDEDWRNLLGEIGASIPEENEGDVSDRPNRIWRYLSREASEEGLQPETIVQLGGIDELSLERAKGSSTSVEKRERWLVESDESGDVSTSGLSHSEVKVKVESADERVSNHRFDRFDFETPRDYHTSVLFNKCGDDGPPAARSYPLYLFYPIVNTDGAGLPFCLHGRFRVETNRKDLSKNSLTTNRQVLEESLDLLELVGEEVASQRGADADRAYSTHLPWALLPPVPESAPDDPETPSELVHWFQHRLLERLSSTACIPTSFGPRIPSETLLHWKEPIMRGYIGLSRITDELERDSTSDSSRPLPTESSLEAALTTPTAWRKRIQAVLPGAVENEISRPILEEWVIRMEHSLAKRPADEPAVQVDASPARQLHRGTIALLQSATPPDEPVEVLLEELADGFDGVYLLPCRIRGEDPDDRLALVTIERRLTPTGGSTNRRAGRSVIWDIESASTTIERPPPPPGSSNMTVYFLDEQIQTVSEVHHVLSLAGRLWGLRAYEGIPSFVRSLLDTFADGRHEVIEPIDFAFLAAIIDRLSTESSDLQTGEASFFPLEYLQTAVAQQEGDQRGNLRRRVNLRACSLALHGHDPARISKRSLGDGWQQLQARSATDDVEDDDPTAGWLTLDETDYPAPLWPEPEAHTWDVFEEQIKRETSSLDFPRTLSLLGVSTLPGLNIVWMYGDDHPSMRQQRHWNPTEWTQSDFTDQIPASVVDLQNRLEGDSNDYLSAVSAAENHPRSAADHSSKCPVKVNGEMQQVNLASWVWTDSPDALRYHGKAVRELLRRHGEVLDETLLRTGWSCNRGHKRRAWSHTIPTLLNWQLRSLQIWEPVLEVDESLADAWSEESDSLQCAVRMESPRGPQAARMFPHVDGESDFPKAVLSALGVRTVDGLGPYGAMRRLQRLQMTLADGELPDTRTTELWIPGERINDWNQAYTQLLQPLMKRLSDAEGDDKDIQSLTSGSITHLPLRDGDRWVTASIDWIVENAEEIRYYPDQSRKPWEVQAVEDDDLLILPRTAAGPFTALASALGIGQVDASKLVFDPEEDDIEIVTGHHEDAVVGFRRDLSERRTLLVASTERTDEEEIENTATTLSTAIADLAVAKSFPDAARRQLSDPASALYCTDDGAEALLLNAEEYSGGALSLDGLAMGLALLVERPTKVATFREALRTDLSVDELESRWTKRTFPVEAVRRVLGVGAVERLERELEALNRLLDDLGESTVEIDEFVLALEEAEPDDIEIARAMLATGAETEHGGTEEVASTVSKTVTSVHQSLPKDLSFVAEGLFTDTLTHWVHEIEQRALDTQREEVIVEWLDTERRLLQQPPFDESARQSYGRLLTATELWEQTDASELGALEMWVERLRELRTDSSTAWTSRLPIRYAETVPYPPRVLFACQGDRIRRLLDTLCSDMAAELTAVEFDWKGLLETYVQEGELPEQKSDSGAKDHQKRAFTDIASAFRTNDDATESLQNVDQRSLNGDNVAAGKFTVQSSGGGGGGDGNQFRGRGQQGEAFVVANVLSRLQTWLHEESGADVRQFRSRFRRLYDGQIGADHQWHVRKVWEQEILEHLSGPAGLTTGSITGWRDAIADGTPFWELPMVKLINVTMERGPGFDVIDPLGPLSDNTNRDAFGLEFAPVEVKAVSSSEPPYSFRLTTNEYRQAKAFLRADIPYVIRLVAVPEPETADWPQHTQIVEEQVVRDSTELNAVLEADRFEEFVKGGYMNFRLG